MIQYTFLHDFRSTKERLAYHKVYLAGQSCQVYSFFAGCIATAHYSYGFLAIEESVASSTGTDTHTRIFLFVFQSQIFSSSTGRDNNRISGDFLFIVYYKSIRGLAQIGFSHNAVANIGAETFSLSFQVVHQHRTGYPIRIAGKVFYFGGNSKLTAGLYSFIKHGRKIGTAGIDSGRVSCRT